MSYYEAGKTGRQRYIDTSQTIWGGTSRAFPDGLAGLGVISQAVGRMGGLGCGPGCAGGWPQGVAQGTQRLNGLRGLLGLMGLGGNDDAAYMPQGLDYRDPAWYAGLVNALSARPLSELEASTGVFCVADAGQYALANSFSAVKEWAGLGYFVVHVASDPVGCTFAANKATVRRVPSREMRAFRNVPGVTVLALPFDSAPTEGFWRKYEYDALGTTPPAKDGATGGGQITTVPPMPGCPQGFSLDPVLGQMCIPHGGGVAIPQVQMCPDGTIVTGDTQCQVGGQLPPPDDGPSPLAKLVLLGLAVGGAYLLMKD
jgi:hypothetical protein